MEVCPVGQEVGEIGQDRQHGRRTQHDALPAPDPSCAGCVPQQEHRPRKGQAMEIDGHHPEVGTVALFDGCQSVGDQQRDILPDRSARWVGKGQNDANSGNQQE